MRLLLVSGSLAPGGAERCSVAPLNRLAERALCWRMGNRARGVMELLFSERAMVDGYERLLAELCARRPGTVHLEHGGHEKPAP